MNDATCRVEDCNREIKVKRDKLCNAHYSQKRKGKPFTPPRSILKDEPKPLCGFDGCGRPRASKGLCKAHYMQFKSTGTTFPINTRQRPKGSSLIRDEQGRKECCRCHGWFAPEVFGPYVKNADGLRMECAECRNAMYMANRSRHQVTRRQRMFGITDEQFTAMLESQGNACAICRTTESGRRAWCIDHDHACCPEAGKSCGRCVRAILCDRCNIALGFVGDNVETLANMIDYLTAHTRAYA